MKLRSQILLFLLLFGLIPLLLAITFNFPLLFNRLELLYHKAHLQSLRDDFRDLDQHLATRHEMVRLLSKFPEPGLLFKHSPPPKGITIDLERERIRYADWLGRILRDQQDITQVLFLDQTGNPLFWLERDLRSGHFNISNDVPERPSSDYLQAGMHAAPGGVLVGPIRFNAEASRENPHRFMSLSLLSPIRTEANPQTNTASEIIGAVVVRLDIGGLAEAYRDTSWVYNNGSYLQYGQTTNDDAQAFRDYPGLEALFAKRDFALWQGVDHQQVIWVPMFATEKNGPLWVGRRVDSSPIDAVSTELEDRVLLIVFALFIAVLMIAHSIAKRLADFSRELLDGIRQVLKNDKPVRFAWQRPQELCQLGADLTELAHSHAQHAQELRQHAKELEESNRYKSQFLANVSHELRTPLNSILLLSKLIANRSELPVESVKQAEVIHRAGADLKALIDNILDLSQIEARKATLHIEQIRLSTLLEELIELLAPQFDAKRLYLRLQIDPQSPQELQSDPDKLRQIIKNFLSNSVKFTQQGGVILRLEGCPQSDSGRCQVKISVTDSGIGIPKDKQQVVFEAFKQADGSTNRRFGGTGLGLTISRELAQLMGGRIDLESAEGSGTTFSLYLPITLDQELLESANINLPVAEQPASPPPPKPLLADFQQRRLLLVDDDLRNLLAMTPLLESWNLQVTAAGDGSEALETLDEEPDFDLVLMDIMMPEMDGFTAIRAIRAQPRFAELPIIALTAKASAEDQGQCLAVGANDFVSKPLDPHDLLSRLEHFLNPDDTGESAL